MMGQTESVSAIGDYAEEPAGRGDLLLALSNAIVRLYKENFGKGPTKARAYYHGDVVTCVLRDGFTRAEGTLVEAGHAESVLEGRQKLQEAVRRQFVEAVQEITGRRVIGFMSGTQLEPPMSAEVFVLEPEPTSPRRQTAQ
jgi:uncharacterized protein YbcI